MYLNAPRGIAVAALLILAGCVADIRPAPMASIAEINGELAQLAAIPNDQVASWYLVAITRARVQCGQFWDQAVLAALQKQRAQNGINAATTLVTALSALAQASGPAIGAIGTAGSVASSVIGADQAASLQGLDPASMATLTAAAQNAAAAALGSPTTAAQAWAAYAAVARACSPAGIEALREQAIQAAPSHLTMITPPAPEPTSDVTIRAPRRRHPAPATEADATRSWIVPPEAVDALFRRPPIIGVR